MDKAKRRGVDKKRVSEYNNVQYDDVYMSRCGNLCEGRGITVPIAFIHKVYSIHNIIPPPPAPYYTE